MGRDEPGAARTARATRATVLSRPIDFGDSYANVVLRNVALGGVAMIAFFQMDKATGGLKRVQFERQPHGVNPPAYRAVVAALEAAYGPPERHASFLPARRMVIRRAIELVWLRDGMTIRAIFRDTTIEAFEGCLYWWQTPPCGLTGQMLVRFAPPGADRPGCAVPASSLIVRRRRAGGVRERGRAARRARPGRRRAR